MVAASNVRHTAYENILNTKSCTMELDQECVGREVIRHGFQGRSLAGSLDTAEEAFCFSLDLVKARGAYFPSY